MQQAKQRTFAPVDPAAVPAGRRASVRTASLDASNEAFHIVAGIGVGLLVVAGAGGLLIRNPRRPRVHAAECPAGQMTGAPSEIASEAPA